MSYKDRMESRSVILAFFFLRSHWRELIRVPVRRLMASFQNLIFLLGPSVASLKSTAPIRNFRHLISACIIAAALRKSMELASFSCSCVIVNPWALLASSSLYCRSKMLPWMSAALRCLRYLSTAAVSINLSRRMLGGHSGVVRRPKRSSLGMSHQMGW